jgi:hypothetical protein
MSQRASRTGVAGRSAILVLAALSLALAVVGGVVLFLETRPYFVSGLSIPARIAALTERGLSPGLSFASHDLVLDDCYAALNSIEGRASPQNRWAALLDSCEGLAADVTRASPTNGYGWLVAAMVAGFRNDRSALAERLERSRVVAPNEGWLAVERIKLTEREGLQTGYLAARDLEVILDAGLTDPRLLRRYAADAAFRGRVNAALDSRSTDVQRRFLSLVRSALAGGRT